MIWDFVLAVPLVVLAVVGVVLMHRDSKQEVET